VERSSKTGTHAEDVPFITNGALQQNGGNSLLDA
jgi:hypothetical protein